MEAPYLEALEKARDAFDQIRREFPEEAQYIVPMAYQMRWYFHMNLRAIQWITELRSSPAGHPTYRFIAQEMARKVISLFPPFEKFLRFVDYEGYDLGRLGQEIRTAARTSGESR
jgi:thymidylate synthase ThyX